ncbi:MAG: hypothetical protein R3336_09550, partial [Phycisphaeraceae bacterium]|nr:hypothetical protein [Phycisphaeraceae bacterium]
VADVARLRKKGSADEVAVALGIADARRRAAVKGLEADQLVADPGSIEKASGRWVADYKAARLAEHLAGAGLGPVMFDLGCGIGADTRALARAGLQPIAVDCRPLFAWLAQINSGGRPVVADITRMNLSLAPAHADPDRRDRQGRRARRLNDYQPGPAFIDQLMEQSPAAAIKLGPGLDVQELPETTPPRELEWISEAGRLVQLIAWSAAAADTGRRATRLDQANAESFTGNTGEFIDHRPESSWLLEPDPALERSDLLGAFAGSHDLGELHPGLGLLTGQAVPDSTLVTPFRRLDEMAWRPEKVRDRLAELGAGIVEVKTRGGAVDPDTAQKDLRGDGQRPLTVFVLRMGRPVRALICERP